MELKEIVKQFTTPKLMKLCVGLVGERDAADLFTGLIANLQDDYNLEGILESEPRAKTAIDQALHITLCLFNVVGVGGVKANECPYGVVCDVAYLCLTYTKSEDFWHDRLMEVAQSALWCIKGIKANAVDVNMNVVVAEVLTAAVSGFIQGVEA